jgi:hypothetical protein
MFVHVLSHRDKITADKSERALDNSERAFASVRRDSLALESRPALARARYHFFRTYFIMQRKLLGAHCVPAIIIGTLHRTKAA